MAAGTREVWFLVNASDLASLEPTKRFSSRVSYYVRARPGYPPGLIDLLARQVGLKPTDRIADVGSGTGLLARVFLDHGNVVFGVEPNAEMRAAGEQQLAGYERFKSVDGTAEATTLPDASVNAVVAGTAFHWFDPARARDEFRRILVPGGWAALAWNERKREGDGFDGAYHEFVRKYSANARASELYSASAKVKGAAGLFYGGSDSEGRFTEASLENSQELDLDGTIARVLSSSNMPLSGPGFDEMLGDLHRLFQRFQKNGKIRIEYSTRVYYGRLKESS
jgi:SAM-dependent methyltransferase